MLTAGSKGTANSLNSVNMVPRSMSGWEMFSSMLRIA